MLANFLLGQSYVTADEFSILADFSISKYKEEGRAQQCIV